jgi:hypothetical protein
MGLEVIKPNIILRNTKTGRIGVLASSLCPNEEVEKASFPYASIVYQGDDEHPMSPRTTEITPFEDLEEYKLRPEDLLTAEHIKKTCKGHTNEQCRYLLRVPGYGPLCARVLGNTQIARDIDWDTLGDRDSTKPKQINCGGRYNKKFIKLGYFVLK